MTRVYENIGPRWAKWNEHQLGRDHGEGKRVSYSGPVLYSYSTPVACYYECDERRFVLASSQKYSPSTSSHISSCTQACTVPVFRVPHIGRPGGWNSDDRYNLDDVHTMNIKHMVEVMHYSLNMALKRWKSDQNWWHGTVHGHGEAVTSYADTVGVKVDIPDYDALIAEFDARIQARRDAWEDPKAVALRERNRARRLAKEALNLA